MRTIVIAGLVLMLGCAALLGPQELIRVDDGLEDSVVFYGRVFSIPEKRHVSKVVLQGEGRIKDIEVFAKTNRLTWQSGRDAHRVAEWKSLKKLHYMLEFPVDIPIGFATDAVRIIQTATTGSGRIMTAEFYAPK